MAMEPLSASRQLSLWIPSPKLSAAKRYTAHPWTSTSTPLGVPGQRSSPSSKTPSPSRSGRKFPSPQTSREKPLRLPPSLGAMSWTSSTHSPKRDSPFREAREPKGLTDPLMAGFPTQDSASPRSEKTTFILLSSPQLLEISTILVPKGEIRLTTRSPRQVWSSSTCTRRSETLRSSKKWMLLRWVVLALVGISRGRSLASTVLHSTGVVVKDRGC